MLQNQTPPPLHVSLGNFTKHSCKFITMKSHAKHDVIPAVTEDCFVVHEPGVENGAFGTKKGHYKIFQFSMPFWY